MDLIFSVWWKAFGFVAVAGLLIVCVRNLAEISREERAEAIEEAPLDPILARKAAV